MVRATLSTKGQIVLPQAIRNQLGLVVGSEFEVTAEGDTIVLRRVTRYPAVSLAEVVGSVAYTGPAKTVDEMNAAIADMLRAQGGSR